MKESDFRKNGVKCGPTEGLAVNPPRTGKGNLLLVQVAEGTLAGSVYVLKAKDVVLLSSAGMYSTSLTGGEKVLKMESELQRRQWGRCYNLASCGERNWRGNGEFGSLDRKIFQNPKEVTQDWKRH